MSGCFVFLPRGNGASFLPRIAFKIRQELPRSHEVSAAKQEEAGTKLQKDVQDSKLEVRRGKQELGACGFAELSFRSGSAAGTPRCARAIVIPQDSCPSDYMYALSIALAIDAVSRAK